MMQGQELVWCLIYLHQSMEHHVYRRNNERNVTLIMSLDLVEILLECRRLTNASPDIIYVIVFIMMLLKIAP